MIILNKNNALDLYAHHGVYTGQLSMRGKSYDFDSVIEVIRECYPAISENISIVVKTRKETLNFCLIDWTDVNLRATMRPYADKLRDDIYIVQPVTSKVPDLEDRRVDDVDYYTRSELFDCVDLYRTSGNKNYGPTTEFDLSNNSILVTCPRGDMYDININTSQIAELREIFLL